MAKNGSSLGSKLGSVRTTLSQCVGHPAARVLVVTCGDQPRLTLCTLPYPHSNWKVLQCADGFDAFDRGEGKCHHFRSAYVSSIHRRNFRYLF